MWLKTGNTGQSSRAGFYKALLLFRSRTCRVRSEWRATGENQSSGTALKYELALMTFGLLVSNKWRPQLSQPVLSVINLAWIACFKTQRIVFAMIDLNFHFPKLGALKKKQIHMQYITKLTLWTITSLQAIADKRGVNMMVKEAAASTFHPRSRTPHLSPPPCPQTGSSWL